jgi:hypothetical protein
MCSHASSQVGCSRCSKISTGQVRATDAQSRYARAKVTHYGPLPRQKCSHKVEDSPLHMLL